MEKQEEDDLSEDLDDEFFDTFFDDGMTPMLEKIGREWKDSENNVYHIESRAPDSDTETVLLENNDPSSQVGSEVKNASLQGAERTPSVSIPPVLSSSEDDDIIFLSEHPKKEISNPHASKSSDSDNKLFVTEDSVRKSTTEITEESKECDPTVVCSVVNSDAGNSCDRSKFTLEKTPNVNGEAKAFEKTEDVSIGKQFTLQSKDTDEPSVSAIESEQKSHTNSNNLTSVSTKGTPCEPSVTEPNEKRDTLVDTRAKEPENCAEDLTQCEQVLLNLLSKDSSTFLQRKKKIQLNLKSQHPKCSESKPTDNVTFLKRKKNMQLNLRTQLSTGPSLEITENVTADMQVDAENSSEKSKPGPTSELSLTKSTCKDDVTLSTKDCSNVEKRKSQDGHQNVYSKDSSTSLVKCSKNTSNNEVELVADKLEPPINETMLNSATSKEKSNGMSCSHTDKAVLEAKRDSKPRSVPSSDLAGDADNLCLEKKEPDNDSNQKGKDRDTSGVEHFPEEVKVSPVKTPLSEDDTCNRKVRKKSKSVEDGEVSSASRSNSKGKRSSCSKSPGEISSPPKKKRKKKSKISSPQKPLDVSPPRKISEKSRESRKRRSGSPVPHRNSRLSTRALSPISKRHTRYVSPPSSRSSRRREHSPPRFGSSRRRRSRSGSCSPLRKSSVKSRRRYDYSPRKRSGRNLPRSSSRSPTRRRRRSISKYRRSRSRSSSLSLSISPPHHNYGSSPSRARSRSKSPFINEINRLKEMWDEEDKAKKSYAYHQPHQGVAPGTFVSTLMPSFPSWSDEITSSETTSRLVQGDGVSISVQSVQVHSTNFPASTMTQSSLVNYAPNRQPNFLTPPPAFANHILAMSNPATFCGISMSHSGYVSQSMPDPGYLPNGTVVPSYTQMPSVSPNLMPAIQGPPLQLADITQPPPPPCPPPAMITPPPPPGSPPLLELQSQPPSCSLSTVTLKPGVLAPELRKQIDILKSTVILSPAKQNHHEKHPDPKGKDGQVNSQLVKNSLPAEGGPEDRNQESTCQEREKVTTPVTSQEGQEEKNMSTKQDIIEGNKGGNIGAMGDNSVKKEVQKSCSLNESSLEVDKNTVFTHPTGKSLEEDGQKTCSLSEASQVRKTNVSKATSTDQVLQENGPKSPCKNHASQENENISSVLTEQVKEKMEESIHDDSRPGPSQHDKSPVGKDACDADSTVKKPVSLFSCFDLSFISDTEEDDEIVEVTPAKPVPDLICVSSEEDGLISTESDDIYNIDAELNKIQKNTLKAEHAIEHAITAHQSKAKRKKKKRRSRSSKKASAVPPGRESIIEDCRELIDTLRCGRFFIKQDDDTNESNDDTSSKVDDHANKYLNSVLWVGNCRTYLSYTEPLRNLLSDNFKDACTNTITRLSLEVSTSTHDLTEVISSASQTDPISCLKCKDKEDLARQVGDLTNRLDRLEKERDRLLDLLSNNQRLDSPQTRTVTSRTFAINQFPPERAQLLTQPAQPSPLGLVREPGVAFDYGHHSPVPRGVQTIPHLSGNIAPNEMSHPFQSPPFGILRDFVPQNPFFQSSPGAYNNGRNFHL